MADKTAPTRGGHRYLLQNKTTGLYWDGRPAPHSFCAKIGDALAVTEHDAFQIKCVYENTTAFKAACIPDELLRRAYAALPVTEKNLDLLRNLSALFQ